MSSSGIETEDLGNACLDDTECQSGMCRDGFCCESECEGACVACAQALTGVANGRCRAARLGTDPHDDCVDEGVASCGTNGTCDGAGACALYGPGTVCLAGTCENATTAANPRTCDGAGSCVDRGTNACGSFACDDGVCQSACSAGAPCGQGAWCNNGVCSAKLADGAMCSGDLQCLNGHCVDGVCCNTTCDGPCVACTAAAKISGPDGICGPTPANIPSTGCAASAADTCGMTGMCDGAGACAFHPGTTVCAPSTCMGSTVIAADMCNGMGACVDNGMRSCGSYLCRMGACLTTCAGDSDCSGGNHCTGGMCVPNLADGSPCTRGTECTTGLCVDGVCCNSACDGTCKACSSALKGGGANGVCGDVAANTDPSNECLDQAASTCGFTGMCNGAGACAIFNASTMCSGAMCNGSQLIKADFCNGSGACIDSGTMECAPYMCSNGACLTSCSTGAQCAQDHFCNAANMCEPKRPLGASCGVPGNCVSGNCVDGVCCNSACNGTCNACSTAKKGGGPDGACGNVAANTDPDNECSAQAASTCGTTGVCDGAGQCALYAPGTVCAPASCNASSANLADECNGAGACVDKGTAPCGAYACAGNACRTTCSVPTDCAPGYACAGNVCKLDLGSGCTSPSQCASNFCVDGVCCDSGCNGTCRSCGNDSDVGAGYCGIIVMGNDATCSGQCCNGACRSSTYICNPQ